MGKYGMTEYYKNCFEKGIEYQDFVSDQLWRNHHICIGAYGSKRWQFERGESASGIEIKFDERSAETGNLYIETEEKANPAYEEYVPSGIYRQDNTWLYLIGNYKEAFLFPKEWLKTICSDDRKRNTQGMKAVEIATSRGFLYPIQNALKNRICIKHFVFSERK